MLRRLEHAARHDEDVTVRQSIEEGVAVAAPRTAEGIEGTLRPDHLVAPLRQRADHAVAPPGARRDIDAERLEVRHGVLHEGAGKGPAERALRAEEGLAQRAAVGDRKTTRLNSSH